MFVGYVVFAPPNRRDAVCFCGRRKCALVECYRDDLFMLVACGALTGGVVGWRVRILRGRILLFVYFRLWLNAGVFSCGNSCDGWLLI